MILPYISASRMETFRTCQFKYYLQYELKEGYRDNYGNLLGGLVHEVLEYYGRAVIGCKDRANKNYKKQLIKSYKDYKPYEKADKKFGWGLENPRTCDDCCWAANKTCRLLKEPFGKFIGCPRASAEDAIGLIEKIIYEKDENHFESKILATELPFDTDKIDGWKYPFRLLGFIDLIKETSPNIIEVVDYKTGKYAKNFEEAWQDYQLRIYDLIVRAIYPKYEMVFLTLDQVRHCPVTTCFEDSDREKTIKYLEYQWKLIQKIVIPARRTNDYKCLCSWCHLGKDNMKSNRDECDKRYNELFGEI